MEILPLDRMKMQTDILEEEGESELCITSKDVPDVWNFKIGEKFTIQMEVEVSSLEEKDYSKEFGKDEDKDYVEAELEINPKSIKILNKTGAKK